MSILKDFRENIFFAKNCKKFVSNKKRVRQDQKENLRKFFVSFFYKFYKKRCEISHSLKDGKKNTLKDNGKELLGLSQ